MESLEPFLTLGLAAAAGLLIGLEREQSAPHQGASFIGGARTHPLVALVGALSMLVERQVGWAAPVAAFAALVVFLVVNYADDLRRGNDRGLTSETAFLLSFLLGALAASQGVVEPASRRVLVVAGAAVVVTLLLSAKPVLHPFASQVSRDDVTAALKFLIVSVVVLPLLPDHDLGPYGVLNPRSLGWMVVLISGIGFVGYAAVRVAGAEQGLGLTGLVGGLASSTAVTLAMSSRARSEPRISRHCALAVVAASTVMCARVAVVVGVLNLPLLQALVAPLSGMGLGGLAAWLWLRRRTRAQQVAGDLAIKNPVELSAAVKFALLFAAVLLGSRLAADRLGAGGIYAAGLVAGAADVDAIALSMARLGGASVELRVAATSVVLGLFSNTLVKAAMATALGGAAFGRTVGAAFAAMAAGGGLGLLLAWR